MKSKLIYGCMIAIAVFSTNRLVAQKGYVDTPPEVSPMPMKPEMTEIWEPQVKVITPAKILGEAPSDAIILFNGKNLDQWVSKKDPAKPAPWKIVNNEYMEVVPGTGDIQTKMKPKIAIYLYLQYQIKKNQLNKLNQTVLTENKKKNLT